MVRTHPIPPQEVTSIIKIPSSLSYTTHHISLKSPVWTLRYDLRISRPKIQIIWPYSKPISHFPSTANKTLSQLSTPSDRSTCTPSHFMISSFLNICLNVTRQVLLKKSHFHYIQSPFSLTFKPHVSAPILPRIFAKLEFWVFKVNSKPK